jgi:DNA polymerase-3 subunit gamma/tau
MSDQALYQKYRPQTFDEVLGQNHVVQALQQAVAQDKVAHAYIFAGTRGTGKTSVARILAASVGTAKRDLYEMDAASNRGIDEIRALREEVHTLPFESRYKIYIIDEVHMLTKEAFNALLKTLEEPPAHVIFILATTELDRLPDTIVSRCQTFQFRTPGVSIIKEMLLKAAKKEKVKLASPAAELIALLASGSFRDAYGVLQKCVAGIETKELTLEDVTNITGTPKSSLLLSVLRGVALRDADAALGSVRELRKTGNDMSIVLELLTRYVRAVLLIREAPRLREELKTEFTEEEYATLASLAEDEKKSIQSTFLVLLLDARMRVGSSFAPELPLELAIIEYLD